MNRLLLFILLPFIGLAQIPPGYYNTANGLTGYTLKTELSNIITNGYSAQSYGSLITLYNTSDNDEYYDNGTQTNTIIDMYSEIPTGADPYNWTIGTSSNCGNFNSEGDCYNREHIFPQGFFSQNEPMRSDAHHVIPTDGWVNGGRSNLPFGEVNPNGVSVTTYMNGSKKGPSITTGFSGDVFEPLDEFKGDIARMLLYFATRYESNRNPFIDNPSYVTMIWTASNNPSGRLFATLDDTFIDVDMDGFGSVGDQITYTYDINNIGTTDLFNIRAVADFGTFVSPGQIAQLDAGNNSTDAFGTLTYTLTAADVASACACVINKITVTADFNAAGTNGSFVKESDDPNDFANVDGNGDMLPDDDTVTNFSVANPSGLATDLFISEYIEGSSNNKAIELANFTGNSINLSSYSLQVSFNGSGSWSNPLALNGTLADQDVYVLARGNANSAITSVADQLVGSSGPLAFNGNDAVGLFKNGLLIDVVGMPVNTGDFAKDETLIRKPEVNSPNTVFDKPGEWNVLGIDDSSDLGMHTFNATASVNSTALETVQVYPNPSTGMIYVNRTDLVDYLVIYDATGRILQRVSDLESGIRLERAGLYFLQLHSDAATRTVKVIVQ